MDSNQSGAVGGIILGVFQGSLTLHAPATCVLHYQPWSFHLLEYQWSEDEFDSLGKLGSAHRVQGTPPLEGGVSSGREDPSPRQQPDPTSSNLTRRFRKVYDSANLNGPGR